VHFKTSAGGLLEDEHIASRGKHSLNNLCFPLTFLHHIRVLKCTLRGGGYPKEVL
jgi:hypothetical protein